jgi:hypothetical protein
MVRAILAGRKTQTRRPLVPLPWHRETQAPGGTWFWSPNPKAEGLNQVELINSPYDHSIWADMNGRYRPGLREFAPARRGDRLWVRETFVLEQTDELPTDGRPYQELDPPGEFGRYLVAHYRATEPEPHIVPQDLADSRDDRTRWSPSIHMPRWASRITLEVVDVHAERLQDLSEQDALEEGCPCGDLSRKTIQALTHSSSGLAAIEWFIGIWEDLYSDPELAWAANPWVWAYEWRRVMEV